VREIIIFASGAGSNCKTIYQHVVEQQKIASLKKIITDNERAGVLDWAQENGIDCEIISPKKFSSTQEFGEYLIQIAGTDTDLIILAGYLKLIPERFIRAFPNKIVNIHPALLPAYGGKGMYGMNVHKAVFENKDPKSGLTIHLIDEKYDHGPVIYQKEIPVNDCKSPEEIAAKVLKQEHQSYWKVVEQLLTRDYEVIDGIFYWKE